VNDSQLSVLVGAGFEELPLVEQLPMVTWVGATGVQIWFNYEAMPDSGSVRRQVADAGLALRSIHAPFGPGCDLSAPDAQERAAAVANLIAALDVLAEVGGEFAVVHPAWVETKMKRRDREQRRRLVAESLARLVPEAEQRGVRLAVENLPPGWLGSRIEDLLEIVETVGSPTVRVCFDLGHANLVGRPVRMWQQAEPFITTMHVHDNDGSGDQHREPFAGRVDWKALRRAMDEADYTGDFVLECLEPLVVLYRHDDTAWRDRFRRWWAGERV